MAERAFELLSAACPDFGRAATLPWDAPVLGFAVADYELGRPGPVYAHRKEFREALGAWCQARGVELVVAAVPAADRTWLALMPQLGFTFFDMTYTVRLTALQSAKLPEVRGEARLATVADLPQLEAIAEQVFQFGRYHADPYVPVELANKRYREWLRNEVAGLGPDSRMYVVGAPGDVRGFFHSVIRDGVARVTIFAIDERYQRGTTGFNVLAGALRDLRSVGVRMVVSRISAVNTGVLNLIKVFGFRYSEPQAVFYWHAPDAPHLLPAAGVFRCAG